MNQITMRQSKQADQEQLAELRALVLYDDLNRLGRYDDVKVRERFHNSFDPVHTWIIEVEGALVGCVALKPKSEEMLLEHFYIHPDYQGQQIGTQVLNMLLKRDEVRGKRVILNVLQGSPARRLYERFGFVLDSEDEVDVFMSVQVH
ncbi:MULTISPECIES: GNAT family N-acetyltransferase [unclassified Paenibacillus]|uniref:GNAT family N-acetyltransferase n=1 Tax=unclassified Paenibacillus TaxID=185978 RepID=UPI0009A7592B|nr:MULTISPECIES: GNAT family N-acetyltransferase [unclassified Paenibacillus]SLK19875.1 N-acetylglutamate synthase, GNAT family [Paenibacillus sp. RU5A]SOC75956.1 N-acetylglutamate synthase, GNAT family [Paenibacillus sp. RU26A]SOC77726.1 N-acetylglutamate synthase, GNAT family [Paenibacillus sp. RU5M]